jgi:hypothetical protein
MGVLCCNRTTFIYRLSGNMGASTTWTPHNLSRPALHRVAFYSFGYFLFLRVHNIYVFCLLHNVLMLVLQLDIRLYSQQVKQQTIHRNQLKYHYQPQNTSPVFTLRLLPTCLCSQILFYLGYNAVIDSTREYFVSYFILIRDIYTRTVSVAKSYVFRETG